MSELLFDKPSNKLAFPNFSSLPAKLFWADFRRVSTTLGDTAWLLKLYDRMEKKVKLTDSQQDDTIIVKYQLQPVRAVYIIRWNPLGYLEVRVPRWSTIHGVETMLERCRTLLNKYISVGDLGEWNLCPVATTLLDERSKNKTLYRVADPSLTNRHGSSCVFNVVDEQKDLDYDPDHDATVTYLLKQGSSCHALRVRWLMGEAEGLKNHEALSTVVGALAKNEITIAAKTTAEAIDYVTYRLRQFAGAAS